MNILEHYPLIIKLIGPHLYLKDRARFRLLVSKETTEDAEDYDETYERDLRRNTCLLRIIKCDGCNCWVDYTGKYGGRHTECYECCKLLCWRCAWKVWQGNCPGCEKD